MAVVRDYSKTELRALMVNPEVNIDAIDSTIRLKTKKRFREEVYPIIERDCKHLITLDEFKRLHIIPRNLIKILFKKLDI